MALLLAALVCAAVDVSLTRADHAHRAAEWMLPVQAIVAYLVWGLVTWVPARITARWSRSRFVSHLVWMAVPVALHHVLRDALRVIQGLMGAEEPMPMSAILGEAIDGQTAVTCGVILAAAIGALIAARVMTRPKGDEDAPTSSRPKLAGALVGVAALAVMVPGVIYPGAQPLAASVSASTTAATERPPNILLLIWDTTRAQNLTPYGYDRDTTPHLAQLAEGGALFENAFSTTVFTLSSHTSMLTGVAPTVHGTTMKKQHVEVPTIVPELGRAGYRTGAFVGTKVLRADTNINEGFDVYNDLVDPAVCDTRFWDMVHDVQAAAAKAIPALNNNGHPHWFETLQRPADEVLDNALAFIDETEAAGQPWFVMINMFDVHWPYLPAKDAAAMFVADYDGPMDGFTSRSDSYPRSDPDYEPTVADRAHIVDLYDAEMYDLDGVVDSFLSELDLAQGGTAVLMTSDHGEGFGEDRHGEQLWSHEHLHGPQTRIPLLIYAPGDIEGGQRISESVSGVDIAPTILDFADVTEVGIWPMLGESLRDLTVKSDRKVFLLDHDNLKAGHDSAVVIFGDYKLFDLEGERSLHHLHEDPLDLVDITSEHEELRAVLDSALDSFLDGSATEGGEIDAATEAVLKMLGYLDEDEEDEDDTEDEDGK